MKKLFNLFAVAILAFATFSCSKDVALYGISLDKESLAMKPGEEATLTVAFDPADLKNIPAVKWETSNASVATVADGVVKAVAAGKATITASVGQKTATCDVTVTADEPEPPTPPAVEDLSLYGTLAEWEQVPAVDGTDAIKKMRVALDENNIYVLMEIAKDALATADVNYANYCTVYYADGTGTEDTPWTQNYNGDKLQLWFVTDGEYKVSNWDSGFQSEVLPKDDVVYYAFALPLANKSILQGDNLYVAATLNDQTVTVDDDGEHWSEPNTIGYAPAADGDMMHVIEGEVPDTFDYTPGAEYLADGNLWKPVDDAKAVKFFYFMTTDFGGAAIYDNVESTECPYLTTKESTYKITVPTTTTERWMNQFFMYPFDASHFVGLDPLKIYKFKMTLQSTVDFGAFFKLEQYNANGAPKYEGPTIWEPAGYPNNVVFSGGQPVVLETEIKNQDCANINLIFDFGGAPAGAVVYIKDITLVETGSVDPAPVDNWDYTPGEAYQAENNLWKPVDADHSITWFYNPNWAGELTGPEVTFEQSTYSFTFAEACSQAEWTSQLKIIPTNEFKLDPNKKYSFRCKIYSGTGTNVFIKMYENGVDWPETFETPATPNRISIGAGETVEIVINDFVPLATPQILLLDFANHSANNTIHIKDITVVETGEVVPSATDFAALDDNAEGKFEGIVAAVGKNGVIVTDGTTNIYVFKPTTTPAVGDKVTVTATKTTYYNLVETKQSGTVTVESSGNEVPLTEAVDVTSTFDAYPDETHTSDLLTVEGTVAVSGSYVNFNVDGATKRQGSIQGMDISSYDGQKVKITGYYAGTSGTGGKFVNIIVTAVEQLVVAGITIDGDMSDWEALTDAQTFEGINNRIVEWKAYSDAAYLFFYYKVTKEKIKDNGSSKFYIGFDMDNDASTGDQAENGGTGNDNGSEALAFFYPWSGTTAVISGEDPDSWVQMPVGTDSGAKITVNGTMDDTYAYVEISIPRSALGSPAAGSTMTVRHAMQYYKTDRNVVTWK